MSVALDAAADAAKRGDLPVGAAIFIDGELVATGSNAVDSCCDDTCHAELIAIRACAPALMRAKRGHVVELYATMEPCVMCADAIAHFRIDRVVFGLEERRGGVGELLHGHPYYDGRDVVYEGGLCADESLALVERFVVTTGSRQHLLESLDHQS